MLNDTARVSHCHASILWVPFVSQSLRSADSRTCAIIQMIPDTYGMNSIHFIYAMESVYMQVDLQQI